IQLDVERVLRVLEDGLVVAGEKAIGEREVIETEGARFGGEVDLETGLREDLKGVQGLGVEEPRFRPVGIDHAVIATDGNQRFAREGRGHGLLLDSGAGEYRASRPRPSLTPQRFSGRVSAVLA